MRAETGLLAEVVEAATSLSAASSSLAPEVVAAVLAARVQELAVAEVVAPRMVRWVRVALGLEQRVAMAL